MGIKEKFIWLIKMIKKTQIDKDIDEFLDIVTKAWCTMDFQTFSDTGNWSTFDPLIANSWTRRILKMINDCKKAGLEYREIAGLFPNVSQIRIIMGFDLWMASYSNATTGEKIKIFNFYSSVLKSYCLEDPYCESKNIIHSQKEIDDFLSKTKKATPSIAKTLGRAVNACYHLSQAMYSDMHPCITYDNYGPYDVSKKYGIGHTLVIKMFKNLKAPELWPETNELSCKIIQIACVYKNMKIIINASSHIIYEGEVINNLKYFSLKVDEKDYSIEKLDKISEMIEKMAVSIFQKFKSLNLEEKKKKYYFTKAYFYKDLYKRLGQDWRPSEDVLAEARGRKLYQTNFSENKEKQKELIRKTLDPRIDFRV